MCDALTVQADRQPPVQQKSSTAGQPPDEASSLLLAAASALAHMLETYFQMCSTSTTQHRSQQRLQSSPESAIKLRTLLSLIAFVGSLSCPVSGGRHSPNLAVSMAEGQHGEEGPREASSAASGPAHEAQAQVESPGVDESAPEQEQELQGSPASQQLPIFSGLQQTPPTSAKQCQEICLRVSLIRTLASFV